MSAAQLEVRVVPAGDTAVAALAWRYRGELRVTVIAKASFSFVPDGAMTRTSAQPIARDDIPYGNSPTQSVRLASDLSPYLNRADVFYTGSAHPPPGVRVETLPVRLGIFEGQVPLLDKTLLIRQKGGFDSVPIVYERAFGGIGWADNPFGVGAIEGSGEPNVVDPFDDRRLAGFGAIGRAWTARRRLLGSTPRRQLEQPLAELPDNLDWEYFQAAPPDQRIAFLRGDEWIVMDGLHPTIPRLRTCLPGARGLACVFGLSPWGVAEGQPLALHADMLRIDGDDETATLTFRGTFPVASVVALDAVCIVAGVELPGAPIPWPDPATLPLREVQIEPESTAPLSSAIELSEGDFESVRGEVVRGVLVLDTAPLPESSEPAPPPPPAPPREPLLHTLEVPAYQPSTTAKPFARVRTSPAPPESFTREAFSDTLAIPTEDPPSSPKK
jgi:hypothetical protein